MIVVSLLLMLAPPVDAQRPDAPPLAEPGPYDVGTRAIEVTNVNTQQPLSGHIWYPAVVQPNDATRARYPLIFIANTQGEAVRNAEPLASEAPYPLIAFSHGSGADHALYLTYLEHLASHGFIVMAVDHPGDAIEERLSGGVDTAPAYVTRTRDMQGLIAHAAALNEGDTPFNGLIDLTRIGVTGHSFGGTTALLTAGANLDFERLADWCEREPETSEHDPARFRYNACFLLERAEEITQLAGLDEAPTGNWPALDDERIGAVVALAPWNSPLLTVEGISAPTMIQVGSLDATTPPERDAYRFYNELETTRALVTYETAGHSIFVDACNAWLISTGFYETCADPVWDMARAHDLNNHLATAFFRSHLYGDEAAAAFLDEEAVTFPGVRYEAVTTP